jgi:VWFA-related protein
LRHLPRLALLIPLSLTPYGISLAQAFPPPPPQLGCQAILSHSDVSAPNSVRLLATDKDGLPIKDLRAEDLNLRANKQEHKILSLTPISDLPKAVGLILDASGSRRKDKLLSEETDFAADFLNSIWHPQDMGFVIEFADRAATVVKPTMDLGPIAAALKNFKMDAPHFRGSTALFDALCFTQFAERQHERGEKIFLVISDFEDNSSHDNSYITLKALREEGIRIFVLLLRTDPDARNTHVSENTAKEFAQGTGGSIVVIKNLNDLAAAAEIFSRELAGAYRLTYEPILEESAQKSLQVVSLRANTKLLVSRD